MIKRVTRRVIQPPAAFLEAIQAHLTSKNAHYTEHYQSLRMPSFSLISILGQTDSYTTALCQRNLPGHSLVQETQEIADQDALVQFAGQVTTVQNVDFKDGYLLANFPQNAEQADQFEDITDGVNLAIQFVEAGEAAGECQVAQYYEQRGQLMTFEVDQAESVEQASARFLRDLRLCIKL